MTRHLVRWGLGLVLVGSSLLSSPTATATHGWQDFYSEWWHSGERTVVWHFDNGFPSGGGTTHRARVKDGADRWNGQNTTFSFDFDASDSTGSDVRRLPDQPG
jgi:hypothetical protein